MYDPPPRLGVNTYIYTVHCTIQRFARAHSQPLPVVESDSGGFETEKRPVNPESEQLEQQSDQLNYE